MSDERWNIAVELSADALAQAEGTVRLESTSRAATICTDDLDFGSCESSGRLLYDRRIQPVLAPRLPSLALRKLDSNRPLHLPPRRRSVQTLQAIANFQVSSLTFTSPATAPPPVA